MEDTEQGWPSSPVAVVDFAVRVVLTVLGAGGVAMLMLSLERVAS